LLYLSLRRAEDDAVYVVIIEDHDDWRNTVAEHLSQLNYEVLALATLAEMDTAMQQRVPDILILDANLPDGNGLNHISRLRASSPHMGIVMLTGRLRSQDRVLGLSSGADHYLTKPVKLAELVATLAALARRLRLIETTTQIEAGIWRYDPAARRLHAPSNETLDLTEGESKLLSSLINSSHTPVSRNSLILALGESPDAYDPHRLDTMVHRLRLKLKGHGNPELQLRNVYGVGYMCITPVRLLTR
jgi:DNA-binding response OmpR family regulator